MSTEYYAIREGFELVAECIDELTAIDIWLHDKKIGQFILPNGDVPTICKTFADESKVIGRISNGHLTWSGGYEPNRGMQLVSEYYELMTVGELIDKWAKNEI